MFFLKSILHALLLIIGSCNIMAMEVELVKPDAPKQETGETKSASPAPNAAAIEGPPASKLTADKQASVNSDSNVSAVDATNNSLQFNQDPSSEKSIETVSNEAKAKTETAFKALLEEKLLTDINSKYDKDIQRNLVIENNSKIYDLYTLKILKLNKDKNYTDNVTNIINERNNKLDLLKQDIDEPQFIHRTGALMNRAHAIDDMFTKMITDITKPIATKYQDQYKAEKSAKNKETIAKQATQEICDAIDPTGSILTDSTIPSKIKENFEADYGPHWYDAILELIRQIVSPKKEASTAQSASSLTISPAA